jgi:hypothetical protein
MKLKQAPVAGLIIKRRKSDAAPEGSLDAQNEDAAASDEGLETCGYAAIQAIHAQDVKAFVRAVKDMFTILDSQPHEEGEHTNEPSEDREVIELNKNTFKAQNVKAGNIRE